jgi:membrane protein
MVARPPEATASSPVRRVERNAEAANRWVRRRRGWARILRNAAVGYFEQAGGRMAAALSYYSIVVGGPVLLLTLALGSALFGEEVTREALAQMVGRVLPPSAEGAVEVARQLVRASTPTAWLALVAGAGSLLGFMRALSASLNVTLRSGGSEPLRRTFLVGPLLLVAVLGLLWGAWAFDLLIELVELSVGVASWPVKLLVARLVPLGMAIVYFAIILAVVPRVALGRREVLVPALFGAILWEGARHVFGWLVAAESGYSAVFGPLGGVVALLGWVYVSCAILILTGQLTWAYAMENRSRGRAASDDPRQAGLEGRLRPFEGDNVVNEDHRC